MEEAVKIIKKLQKHGHYALLVGGCVRDSLMGVKPKDYDIVSSALPEQVEALFKNTLPVGKQFGVIIVNNDYEVATFRQDRYKGTELTVDLLCPKTHSLEELILKDAHKRDLTINSCYYDPISDKQYDPVGGANDLKLRQLYFVGDTQERIKEDPIRILRFIRFMVKYPHLKPDAQDIATIESNFKLLSDVSKERIFTEMTKILMNFNSWDTDTFELLLWLVQDVMNPVFEVCNVFQSPIHHPEGILSTHTFHALKALRVKTPETVWATFLHDLGKVTETKYEEDGRITAHGHDASGAVISEELLRELKCSNKFIDEVVYIVKNHMRIKETPMMKKAKVIKLIKNKYYRNLLEVSCADSMGAKGNINWYHWIQDFELSDKCPKGDMIVPLVTGKDLISLGFSPGEHFKKLLSFCLDLQLEDKTKTKHELLDILMKEK